VTLSGLDAAFLSLETRHTPMHIGGVSLLDTLRADGSRLDFAGLRAHVAARAAALPVFRRRLAPTPFDLGRPSWVDDGMPDLDFHVERTTLPEPGGDHELLALASFEFAQPLDRGRPLWRLLWVEGLERVSGVPAGAVALISRVHHAAVDGVSGAEILAALLAPTPKGTAAVEPEAPASVLARLGQAGRELAGIPLALPGAVAGTVKGLAAGALAALSTRLPLPPLPFGAPTSLFNAPISAERSWADARFDLSRIKTIKDAAGATVNDVVLAICAGALRRWLAERDGLPTAPLIAMVPVSVRPDHDREAMGNQVSALLVSLATDVADARARLAAIRDGARAAKTYHKAVGAESLADAAALVPFGLAGVAIRLYTGLHLAERHRPAFNLIITNVPGPRTALSLGGAPLLAHSGQAPVFDGLGLVLAVFSYAGTLSIGVTACAHMMPRAAGFAEALVASLDELEVGVLGPLRIR
jgi:diacylglycerol O-acyltransferase